MKRRTFVKLGGMLAASGMLGACGQVAKKIVPYVVPPDEGINPVEGWFFATTCRVCEAGCGVMIRTVEGRAKKVEGNPYHPVNSGSTCARGQAAVQQLYHPERVKQPLKRVGKKGSNEFQPVSWDEAIKLLASKIGEAKGADGTFVISNSASDITAGVVGKLLNALGSGSFAVPTAGSYETYEKASAPFQKEPSIPYYNISNAKFVLLLGADILESGFSLVHYGRQYGHMRRGDAARRGTLVYVGPRLSLTAANADKYIGVKPGVLGILAMGIAHEAMQVAVDKRLLPSVPLGAQGKWLRALEKYSAEEVSKRTGVSAEMVKKLAAKFVEASPAVAVAGDDVAACSNGLESLKAVKFLNLISTEIARAREDIEPWDMPESNPGLHDRMKNFIGDRKGAQYLSAIEDILEKARSGKSKLGLIINTNPVHSAPGHLKVAEAMSKVGFVACIGQFLNDTTVYADLVLPEHHFLETWSAQVSQYPAGVPIFNLQQPVVNPLYDTRHAGDIMIAAAKNAGIDLGIESSEVYIKKVISEFRAEWREIAHFDDIQAWEFLLSKGGWWSEVKEEKIEPQLSSDQLWKVTDGLQVENPEFSGEKSHSFYLHPYTTLTMGDGSVSNLPWLQEMPEPMTTLSWGSWVEINPKRAKEMEIKEGDVLKISSIFGSIEASAYIFPGISPDMVAVPFGYGHRSFGKYASNRGANANALLGGNNPGDIPWRNIRVSIEKTGKHVKMVRDADPRGEYKGEVFQM